jgi:nucleotide-binding universal stress UspA family protein
MFRDDRGWWSLSTNQPLPLHEVVWLVDLDQLGYHPVETHRPFLEEVLATLSERAESIQATVRPATSIEDALRRVERVRKHAELEQAVMVVLLSRTDQAPVPNEEWMHGLEVAGLRHGDGDLYWAEHQRTEICAEPWSDNGWFHPGGPPFRNVALHVRISDVADLVKAAQRLHFLAQKVTEVMDVVAVSPDGRAFHPDLAVAEALRIRKQLEEA